MKSSIYWRSGSGKTTGSAQRGIHQCAPLPYLEPFKWPFSRSMVFQAVSAIFLNWPWRLSRLRIRRGSGRGVHGIGSSGFLSEFVHGLWGG